MLARLVHASPAVLYSCKVAGDCGTITVTDNVLAVLGYTPADFVGDPSFWAVRIHPEDSARVFAEMPQLFAAGEQVVAYRFRHANGRYVQLQDQMKLECDATGQPARILGCWIEMTSHQEANAFSVRMMSAAPETTTTTTEGGSYATPT